MTLDIINDTKWLVRRTAFHRQDQTAGGVLNWLGGRPTGGRNYVY